MGKYELGKWDLSDLVKNPKSPAFEKQIALVEKKARQFEKIKTKLDTKMSQKKFFDILHDLEDISEKLSVVSGFASLSYASDTQSDEATSLLTRMSKIGSQISNRVLFFDLWWKRVVDEKNAKRLIKGSGQYLQYLTHKRLLAKYSLTEPEERIINTLDVTGVTALVKLYDKITNAFEYQVKIGSKTKKMTREELTSLVHSPKLKIREAAYKSLFSKFKEDKGVLGEIYQNIVLNWKDEGIDIRGYPTPISLRNVGNDVDDKTITSLLEVCIKKCTHISEILFAKSKNDWNEKTKKV